jgi:hypothetical protein
LLFYDLLQHRVPPAILFHDEYINIKLHRWYHHISIQWYMPFTFRRLNVPYIQSLSKKKSRYILGYTCLKFDQKYIGKSINVYDTK